MNTETRTAALRRLRRKLEVMSIDARPNNTQTYGDIKECLALVEILEKEMAQDARGLD